MRLSRILSTTAATALAVALLTGTTGCGNKAGASTLVVLGLSDNGKTVEVAQGATVEVRLAANPTTGYQWQTKDLDTSVVEQVSSNYQAPTQQMPGAGGTQVFRFKTLKVAETELTLIYVRSWETNVAPAQTWAVKLNIAKGSTLPDSSTENVEKQIEEGHSTGEGHSSGEKTTGGEAGTGEKPATPGAGAEAPTGGTATTTTEAGGHSSK